MDLSRSSTLQLESKVTTIIDSIADNIKTQGKKIPATENLTLITLGFQLLMHIRRDNNKIDSYVIDIYEHLHQLLKTDPHTKKQEKAKADSWKREWEKKHAQLTNLLELAEERRWMLKEQEQERLYHQKLLEREKKDEARYTEKKRVEEARGRPSVELAEAKRSRAAGLERERRLERKLLEWEKKTRDAERSRLVNGAEATDRHIQPTITAAPVTTREQKRRLVELPGDENTDGQVIVSEENEDSRVAKRQHTSHTDGSLASGSSARLAVRTLGI